MPDFDDALAGMTRREIEGFVARATVALQSCAICGAEHADAFRITGRRSIVAAILICAACFEKSRLPEGRVTEDGNDAA